MTEMRPEDAHDPAFSPAKQHAGELSSLRVVAIILARGGSKGLPGKNIRPLLGIPLLAHSIRQARQARLINQVYVSTDSPEIAAVAREYGAQVIDRPTNLSGDKATSESGLVHAIEHLRDEQGGQPDLVCFLQCTSPIRAQGDIDHAVEQWHREGCDSLLSVSPSHRFLWQRGPAGAESINYDWENRPRRQDMKPQFVENGSIYLFRPDDLLASSNRLSGRIGLFEMDELAAFEIDSLLDFQLVELIVAHLQDQGATGQPRV